MAVQYSNLPYQSTNPSGIGNVIFNQSQDAFETHLQNLQKLDEGEKERQRVKREKQQTTGKLLADVDFNSAGILDSDVPYFKEQSKNLHDFTTQAILHGLDPNTPLGAQAENEIRFRAKQIEIDAEASKAAKAALLAAQKEINERPDRYDLDASNTKIAKFRAAPLKDRSNLEEWGQLLVPKKANGVQLLTEFAKGRKPSFTSEIVQLPNGGQSVKTETFYSPNELARAAMQDKEIRDARKRDFENEPIAIQESAIKRAGAMGDPIEVYTADFYGNYFPKESEKYGSVSYSPMERQYAKLWGETQHEKQAIAYTVDRFDSLLKGGDETFKKVAVSLNDLPKNIRESVIGAGSPMIPPIEMKVSGVLAGTKLGKTTIPYVTKDGLRYEDFDDEIVDFAEIGGKLYVQTLKSQLLATQSVNGQPLGDKYVPVDEDFIDDLTSYSKTPYETKEALKQELTKRGIYNNGVFVFGSKNVPTTAQPTAEVVKVKVKLANGKTGEIPENQLEAFKKKYPDATVIYGR